MQDMAKKHGMVMVVPVFEEDITGLFYNTAAVLDSDGTYLGKYRKNHLPHVAPGFWEKFYFRPGNLGYPVFDTTCGKLGVYICYDRHFPEGARALGLAGAEIVLNPSATVAGLSDTCGPWSNPPTPQPMDISSGQSSGRRRGAMGNRRVLREQLLLQSQGQIIAQASRDRDEVVTADLDLDEIAEVRTTWQFYRDRRPIPTEI